MKRISAVLLSLSLLPLVSASAANRAIIFGGNCEDDLRRNVFESEFVSQAEALRDASWDVRPLYDGLNHQSCRPGPGKNAGPVCDDFPFGPAALERELGVRPGAVRKGTKKELVEQLKQAARQLKKGDQLLLMVNTHGGPGGSKGVHTVCLADGTAMPLDDKEFTDALTALTRAQVKMAFTDASCFGGGAVPALSRFGCVVTSQSANRVASGWGVARSIVGVSKLKPRQTRSMQDLFIHALLNGHDTSINGRGTSNLQPQISGFDDGNAAGSSLLELVMASINDRDAPKNMGMAESCQSWDEALAKVRAFAESVTGLVKEEEYRAVYRQFTGRNAPRLHELKALLAKQLNERAKEFRRFEQLAAEETASKAKLKKVPYTVNYDLSGLTPAERKQALKTLEEAWRLVKVDGQNILLSPPIQQGKNGKVTVRATGLDLYFLQRGDTWQRMDLLQNNIPPLDAIAGRAEQEAELEIRGTEFGKARDRLTAAREELNRYAHLTGINSRLDSPYDVMTETMNVLRFYKYMQKLERQRVTAKDADPCATFTLYR